MGADNPEEPSIKNCESSSRSDLNRSLRELLSWEMELGGPETGILRVRTLPLGPLGGSPKALPNYLIGTLPGGLGPSGREPFCFGGLMGASAFFVGEENSRE